jgi:hypothetical protein
MKHMLVKEEQGGERLGLCRGRDVPGDCKMRQECFHCRAAERLRVLAAVELNEAHRPSNILFFRAITVVTLAYFRPEEIKNL